MSFDPEKITFFAKTDARGQNIPFGIKAKDRTKHMYVIGKTGMGKSTLLENMAVQDIKNGEGMAFIDPHGATAETLLDYVPEERKKDVVYFAPFDAEHPIAFNVMEDVGADKRHLVVSGLMSVFKKIWVDAWSARMEYILQNTLLALLEYPDSTLLGVNRMLSEKNYRRKVIDNISDPSVKSFWVDEFLKYNERYMQEAGDAIKNKIGQFTANPLIRNIIGQPKSSFDLRKMMDERKIIIMNLSKGLVGESNANLLGSMLTTRIYLAAMSRADVSQADMRELPNFYFYVDEFQSFANATFADILSEARKYKLNLTIAHQYIEQMEEEVRNAVFGNVGTIISFRVGPFDAEVLETIYAPQFYAVDICNLGFAQVYMTLMIDGIGSQPFSAVTLPPIEPASVSCKDMIIHTSRTLYARPRAQVEEAILEWHEEQHAGESGSNRPLITKKPDYSAQNNNKRPERPERRDDTRSNNSGDRNRNNSDRNAGGNGYSKDDRRASPPRREDSRPETASRDDRRSDTGGRPRNTSNPTKEKNLDELRSVLANLSNKEGNKKDETKNSEKPYGQIEKTNATSIMDIAKNTRSTPRESKPAQTEDPAAALKATLAKIIGDTNTNSDTKKVEEKSKENLYEKQKNNQEQPSDFKNEKTSSEKTKSPSESIPENKPSPKPEVETPAEPQLNQSAKISDPVQLPQKFETKGPIDPKVLERMMRVKSTDKTPFK